MSAITKKLSPKQEAAVLALVSSRSLEEAARAAGVTLRTFYPWQKEPEFETACREATRAAYKQSIARMHQMASAAVTTLGKVMVDKDTPAATKVRAADSILNHTAKAIELEDIEALERATEANHERGR